MDKRLLKEIGSIIMLVMGFLLSAYSWATTFFDSPAIPIVGDWRIGLGAGLLLFFAGTLFYILELQRKYRREEPEISMTFDRKPVMISPVFKSPYEIAQITILNKEQLDITNCYATLEYVNEIYWSKEKEQSRTIIPPQIPYAVNQKNLLKWDEDQEGSANCKTTIPRSESKTFNVVETDMQNRLEFYLCNRKLVPEWLGTGIILCEIRVRVDGDFNGRPMKPLYFSGFAYSETIPVFYGELRQRMDIQKMGFYKGNWRKYRELATLIAKSHEEEKQEAEAWDLNNQPKPIEPTKVTATRKKSSRRKR